MDIGTAIRKSRMDAGLSQEQAAQKLSISRQTLSSWENGRTYPGIQAVLKMTEAYRVSLDTLLKGLPPEAGYMAHLKVATSEPKAVDFWWKTAVLLSSGLIWCLCLLLSWRFYRDPSGAGRYGVWMLELMCGFLFAGSLVIGLRGLWSRMMWLAPLIYGFSFFLIPVLTREQVRVDGSDLEVFLVGGMFSALGLLLGNLIGRSHKKDGTA